MENPDLKTLNAGAGEVIALLGQMEGQARRKHEEGGPPCWSFLLSRLQTLRQHVEGAFHAALDEHAQLLGLSESGQPRQAGDLDLYTVVDAHNKTLGHVAATGYHQALIKARTLHPRVAHLGVRLGGPDARVNRAG